MKITEQISVSDPYLLFVPSLLKPTFERDGLNTVSDLLSLHPSDFESRKGWGKLDLTRFGGYLMSNQKGDPLCHQPVPLTQPS